jgi:NAD(P)-dependent dehydrogenase (short-subunit alcohol dehydrogenase family)
MTATVAGKVTQCTGGDLDVDDVLGYAGKRAVVTGAASGMGEATADVLVGLGARVVAIDVKPTTVAADAALEVDLRDQAAIDAAVGEIDGPVDAVFACAGLPGPPFSDLDVLLVNFIGTRHLLEGLVPKMPGGSAIAWIASNAGIGWQQQLPVLLDLIGTDGFEAAKRWVEDHPEAYQASSYAFSKQVINAFVSSQAGTYWRNGRIRLNASNPGPTETAMMPFFHEMVGKQLVDAALGPIDRYSTPTEQAWPIVMLNSPRMSYVTGEVLMVDGGFFGALTTGQIDFSQLLSSD